jgi:hypothetical protein
MKRVMAWLRRIPAWVWLILAISQVLTLVQRPFRISSLDEALARMPEQTEYAGIRHAFQEIRQDCVNDLISAGILATIFLTLMFWRWSNSKKQSTETLLSRH